MLTSKPNRVVKLEELAQGTPHVAFNFDDIRERCENFIEQTREKTTQMLLKAHEDGEKVKSAAMQQGIKEGEAQGLKNAEKLIHDKAEKLAQEKLTTALGTLKPALVEAADRVRLEKEVMLTAWESQLIHLAAALAKRITQRQIAAEPAIALEMIQGVLQACAGESQIQLSLHPEDLKMLQKHLNLDDQTSDRHVPLSFQASSNLSRGDCVVQSQFGQIDARLEAMLDRMAAELVGS